MSLPLSLPALDPRPGHAACHATASPFAAPLPLSIALGLCTICIRVLHLQLLLRPAVLCQTARAPPPASTDRGS